jgi:hypothetical protein
VPATTRPARRRRHSLSDSLRRRSHRRSCRTGSLERVSFANCGKGGRFGQSPSPYRIGLFRFSRHRYPRMDGGRTFARLRHGVRFGAFFRGRFSEVPSADRRWAGHKGRVGFTRRASGRGPDGCGHGRPPLGCEIYFLGCRGSPVGLPPGSRKAQNSAVRRQLRAAGFRPGASREMRGMYITSVTLSRPVLPISEKIFDPSRHRGISVT